MRWPDTSKKPEAVVFRRVVYRLMGTRTYYLAQHPDMAMRKQAKGLHVAVWEAANKMEVPKGLVCHHRDHNPFNNHPDNLEVLTHSEHRRHHPVRDKITHAKHLERIRPLTKAWHASEEGRKVHRENAKAQWVGVAPRDYICRWCGQLTQSRGNQGRRYCGQVCNFRARRFKGELDKTVQCKKCGKEFVAKPFDATGYPARCSKKCGARSKPWPHNPPPGSPILKE